MVRLLLAVVNGKVEKPQKFQSHNGAIAAIDQDRWDCQRVGFNPTMVRLLQQPNIAFERSIVVFQSHNGAIAACKG